jgi:hypothetical protein
MRDKSAGSLLSESLQRQLSFALNKLLTTGEMNIDYFFGPINISIARS